MKSFKKLLDARVMIPHYKSLSPLTEMWATNWLWNSGPAIDTLLDKIEMLTISTTSRPGKVNMRDGKANVIQPRGASKMFHGLLRQFDMLPLSTDALHAMRDMDSEVVNVKAVQALEIQLEEMANLQQNFQEVALAHILTFNRLNFNADNELLLPSVHATTGVISDDAATSVTADFGIPNANRGDLGGIVSALWSTAATRIDTQLDALKRAARVAGLPVPTDITVNGQKKSVLRSNTEFRAWAVNHQLRIDQVLSGEGIKDLWGFNWHFVDSTYTDISGTVRDVVPATSAVITAPMNGRWVKRFNGSELVNLKGQLAFANAQQALESLDNVYGKFAYARLSENPAQVQAFAGNNWGVGFAAPAIWVPTVFA